MTLDDINFHSERARIELERARAADNAAAAHSHELLSLLHTERMRVLSETVQMTIPIRS